MGIIPRALSRRSSAAQPRPSAPRSGFGPSAARCCAGFGEDGLVVFRDIALLGDEVGLSREAAEVLGSRAPRGVRDRWLALQRPPCCLGFVLPRWLPWDIVGCVELVLLHRFESVEALGLGGSGCAGGDDLVELKEDVLLGDLDLPCRAAVEPGLSESFWFL